MSKCVVIGCGTMGTIFLEGVLQFMPSSDIAVIERTPTHATDIQKKYGVSVITTTRYDASQAELIILAVKPQDSAAITTLLGKSAEHSLIVSMMAGVPLARLQTLTGSKRIVRCMPNTPAKIGLGMTAWTATPAVTATDTQLVEKILRSFGEVIQVQNDDWIDKATAVSGSGPAYVFAYAEYLMSAAQTIGFSPEHASLLVQQTMAGAIALWQKSTLSPTELRTQVTSKGGTTAAALHIFDEAKTSAIIQQAISAAYKRAQELSQ